jgi:nitroreductase
LSYGGNIKIREKVIKNFSYQIMKLYDLIIKRRSIRRFKQRKISLKILKKIVNAGRLAPSAGNLQPIEYIIVNDKEICEKIFECLRWAAYLNNWIPSEKERPTSYIILLVNTNIKKENFDFDCGAAAENICLAALYFKIGSCILTSIDKDRIRKILKVPRSHLINSVIALGYPKEKAVAENMKKDIKYYRDEKGVHHVPKRKLEDIIHLNKF